MITSVHTLIYSDDAAATRAFLKDVLRFPCVAEPGRGDEGRGATTPEAADPAVVGPGDWLIFGTGRSELGVHPTMTVHDGREYTSPRQHQIALMCDDLDTTMQELTSRGAEFSGEARDMGFGLGVMLRVPGPTTCCSTSRSTPSPTTSSDPGPLSRRSRRRVRRHPTLSIIGSRGERRTSTRCRPVGSDKRPGQRREGQIPDR